MRALFRGLFTISIAVAAFGTAIAQTLTVTRFDVQQTRGGLTIQAEYDLGPNPCCPPERVRWLQRILLTDAAGNRKDNVPGYPIGDFIDPQPTQPGGPWDNLPWYDVTYNTAADRNTDTNRQGGRGRFFNDSPGGWGPFGPMCFSAWTAIVCIDETTKTAEYMGGFTWGFCVAANGTISGVAPAALANNAATAAIFNGSLALGPASFREWSVRPGDPNCQLTFSAVPEPATMTAMGMAFAAMVLRRRRRSR
jgi:hypothetical protein